MAKRGTRSSFVPADLDEQDETVTEEAAAEEVAADIAPDTERHVFLGDSMLDIADLGLDTPRERRITHAGVNYEHVDEHESGCWRYRQM